MQTNLTVKHVLEVPLEGDLVRLTLEYINNLSIRAMLSGNGVQHNLIVAKSAQQNAVSFFLSKEAEDLASRFDVVGRLANAVDGAWIVEKLKIKLETSEVEDKPAMAARIDRLVAVNSLMTLHALGNDIMVEFFGHNWVAEYSSQLVKKSEGWKALVERVQVAQEGLKAANPT